MFFIVSAFLSAARSIADHVLKDYNQQFGLQMAKKIKLNARMFKDQACNLNIQQAWQFVGFYDTEFQKIKTGEIPTICEKFLAAMKAFVNTISQQYP